MSDVTLSVRSTRFWRTAAAAALAGAAVLTSGAPFAQGTWEIEQVVTTDVAGHSLAFGPDGGPTIAYSLLSRDQDDVRFASRGQAGVWSTEFVDSGRNYHNGLSLAFRADGRPGITYGFGPIKLAEKTGQSWAIQTVFKGSATTNNTSLVYRGNVPHVSFSSGGGKSAALTFAYRPATKWIVETVDRTGDGGYSSLSFDPLGRAVIAYAASSDQRVYDTLKLAVRGASGGWTTSVLESAVTGYGVHVSLAFSTNGNPFIVHGSGALRVVEFVGDWTSGSGAWTPMVLDPGPFAAGASVAFDNDEPVVSWRQTDGTFQPNLVKVARRMGEAWNVQQVASFEPPVNWIGRTSLALQNGRPSVSFDPQAPGQWSLSFAQAVVEP